MLGPENTNEFQNPVKEVEKDEKQNNDANEKIKNEGRDKSKGRLSVSPFVFVFFLLLLNPTFSSSNVNYCVFACAFAGNREKAGERNESAKGSEKKILINDGEREREKQRRKNEKKLELPNVFEV